MDLGTEYTHAYNKMMTNQFFLRNDILLINIVVINITEKRHLVCDGHRPCIDGMDDLLCSVPILFFYRSDTKNIHKTVISVP